jgi:hypothetical protein
MFQKLSDLNLQNILDHYFRFRCQENEFWIFSYVSNNRWEDSEDEYPTEREARYAAALKLQIILDTEITKLNNDRYYADGRY